MQNISSIDLTNLWLIYPISLVKRILSLLRKMITTTVVNRCWKIINWTDFCNQDPYWESHHPWQLYLPTAVKQIKDFWHLNRTKLISILEAILVKCELQTMHLLINDVILNVKIVNKATPIIHTNIEIYQGDCLFALLTLPPQAGSFLTGWLIEMNINIGPKYTDKIFFKIRW